jgi:hypothetical protein
MLHDKLEALGARALIEADIQLVLTIDYMSIGGKKDRVSSGPFFDIRLIWWLIAQKCPGGDRFEIEAVLGHYATFKNADCVKIVRWN